MSTPRTESQTVEEQPDELDEGDAIVHLATVLRAMLFLGVGIVVVGVAIGLIRDGELPTETVDISHLLGEVGALHADGVLTLGILTFLASPIVALIYLCYAFLRARDLVYTAVSAIIFSIILGSFIVARFT